MALLITYGSAKFWGADVLISTGAQPSRTVLYGDVGSEVTDGPSDLILADEDLSITFRQMKLLSISNRPVRWGDDIASEYIVEDRRYKWWDTSHSCSFNKLLCNGLRVDEKPCAEIFRILLQEILGEIGVDISQASQLLFPRLVYDGEVPVGRMLDDLCRMTHHTIGFNEAGNVAVYSLGKGIEPNASLDVYQKSFRQAVTRNIRSFKAISKPTVYESLVTLTPRAMEEDGELVSLDDVSYKPASGWGQEWPGHFSGVASGSQHLAMKSVYKLFIAGSGENDKAVGEHAFGDGQMEIFNDGDCVFTDDQSAVLVDTVTGSFWPEYHRGDVASADTDYWRGVIEVSDNIFKTERPVFKVSGGTVSPPTLKVRAWHKVRKEDGSFTHASRGGGPERLAEWVQPILVHEGQSNLPDVHKELDEFKRINDEEAAVDTKMAVYGGLRSIETNGKVRAVRHKAGLSASSGSIDTEVYIGDGWGGLTV